MSQERSLPDKYYGENGIHRVPMWRIAGFALNNTSTNMYMCFMQYVAYYLAGWVGVGTVAAGSFSMAMRIWDGVTDPVVGLLVDKTNGRFGKNRPFMVIGNVILFVTSWILFHVTHTLPMGARFPFFVVISAIYYLGYTCQCVVTKSAQSALTNDPKQRPLFAVFDGAYNTILFSVLAMVVTNKAAKYGGLTVDPGLYGELQIQFGLISAVMCAIAVFCIAPKDRAEFFGTGATQKVGLKDYVDTLCHNRAIQMLIVSAATDKLSTQMKSNSATMVCLMGIVVGNYSLYASTNAYISIPTTIIMMLLVGSVATKLGQKKAMLIGSWGGIIINALLIVLWLFGDYKSMDNGEGGLAFSAFTIIYIFLSIALGSCSGLSGNIVIPMTADCADYEVYRTGKYVPGLMGTLFSFVDKLVSSFAPMLVSVLYASIGFKDQLPDISDPYSDKLFYITLFCMYGTIIIGNIFNVIAMKFYPLTKEKMASIQEEIAAIKAKAGA